MTDAFSKIRIWATLAVLLTVQASLAAENKYMDINPEGIVYLSHESINNVKLSNREINRIVSKNADINTIKMPEDASISAEITGKDAFIRCRGTKSELIYIVSSQNQVYAVRIKPADIGARELRLIDADKEKEDALVLFGNEREKLAVKIIQAAFTEDPLMENATITNLKYQKVELIKDIEIRQYRRYDFNEDQLRLMVYLVKLSPEFKYPEFKIEEKNFLIPKLFLKPLGIAIDRDKLDKKNYTRLFIVGRI
ncbi:MAG: type-F conjugative transfer system secretin TraK [Candidatus Promineifilaceae bacterium]|jgi:hypothetical protein